MANKEWMKKNESPSKQKTIDVKVLQYLEIHVKEFDTKLQHNFRKVMENGWNWIQDFIVQSKDSVYKVRGLKRVYLIK